MILPKTLRQGDTIAIISPSSWMGESCPHRIERAEAYLKSEGFLVRTYGLRGVQERTERVNMRIRHLHSAFEDEAVGAVLCSVGGVSANELLDRLDYDIISANPKVFCGYSDITLLHHAIARRCSLKTFYGPMAITQFGEYPRPLSYTTQSFFSSVSNPVAQGAIPASEAWTSEFLDWTTRADSQRPRSLAANSGPVVICGGCATGPIVAGCLPSILQLKGTAYEVDYREAILAIDIPEGQVVSRGLPLQCVESFMVDLRLAGILDAVSGIMVGRAYGYCQKDSRELHDLLRWHTRTLGIPVIAELDFGHTDPMMTIPMFAITKIDTQDSSVHFLEPGVKDIEV